MMTLKHLLRFLLLLALVAGSASAKPKKPKVETWKSANGHTFQGTFVSFANGTVRLKGAEGKLINVPISALDEESKARVFEYSGEAVIANPLLKHTSQNVDFEFGEAPQTQYLQIRLKKAGGQPIPYYGKINVRFSASETVYRENGKPGRKRMKLQEIVTETSDDSSGTFRLKYDKGLEALITVKAVKDGVEFSQRMDVAPSGIENPNMGCGFSYDPILEFDKTDKLYRGPYTDEAVPFAKLDAMFANYKATAVKGKKTTSFTFDESPKGLSGTSITLSTPNAKDIVVEAVDVGTVKTSFYGGKKMIEGFGMGLAQIHGKNADKTFTYRISLK